LVELKQVTQPDPTVGHEMQALSLRYDPEAQEVACVLSEQEVQLALIVLQLVQTLAALRKAEATQVVWVVVAVQVMAN
jgi:hypothetical protein